MNMRKAGKTQEISAVKAGISERSGREIEKGHRIDPKMKQRHWRTRTDPFSMVWISELEPLLKKTPFLTALTLLEYIQSRYGAEIYPDKLLRTLQRRVKLWQHQEGPAKAVIFRQNHEPGYLGLSDFTTLKEITVTVQGKTLKPLLYHFRVIYSGWSYMKVILGGESFVALSEGLQNALWCLGGSPKEHRTDSLSAAFKNLSADAQEDQSRRYQELCQHYGMKPSRNNRGVSHENGGIESPHGHLKRRIKQAFLLRGSTDFDSVEAYQEWIDGIVNQHNRRHAKDVEIEQSALQLLPTYKSADYTVLPAKVNSSSTIQVRSSLYSVPSRLIGANLQVHLYQDHLCCYLSGSLVAQMHRVYGQNKNQRARNIDYRHVIDSLVKKPGAFFGSKLRDAILPNAQYRQIWKTLISRLTAREASRLMVGILHLAAKSDCEIKIGAYVEAQLLLGKIPMMDELKKQFCTEPIALHPEVVVTQHSLRAYNQLIPSQRGISYAIH